MEYITEINMFFDWLESNPMKASGIALWFALMDTANKSRWSEDFSVAISTLRSKTGCTRDQIYAARNQLQQKGRILFRQRTGNQSAVYRMIPFVSDIATQTSTQIPQKIFVSDIATQSTTQTSTQSTTQTPNIIRLDNIQTRHDEDGHCVGDARPREEKNWVGVLFARYFGRAPLQAEEETCIRWLQRKDAELVEYAFWQAVMAQNPNLRYVAGILKNLEARNIRDMGDLAEYDMRQARRM